LVRLAPVGGLDEPGGKLGYQTLSDHGTGIPSGLIAVEQENDLSKMLLQKFLLPNGE
jgi:hypothetical protein